MKDNNAIEYEDHKVPRYRIKNGIEFYLISDIASTETEREIGFAALKAGDRRALKRNFHALIVHDPSFGTMPYPVWEEKTRLQVMGTITPYMDSPPSANEIIVTASGALRSEKEFGLNVIFVDKSKNGAESNDY